MASKRRLRRKSCDGKVRHADAAGGLAHIGRLARSGSGGSMNVYRCQFCKGYHIGHRSKIMKLRHTS